MFSSAAYSCRHFRLFRAGSLVFDGGDVVLPLPMETRCPRMPLRSTSGPWQDLVEASAGSGKYESQTICHPLWEKLISGAMGAIRSFSAARPRRNREGTRIRRGLAVPCGALAVLLSGCAGATGTISPPVSDAEVMSPSASASSITSGIVGYWHRAQTCDELVPAFEAAGLAVSHRGWLQGNFYGGAEGPATGDVCAGAEGPLEHSHWFTETGEFGSHDQTGQ